MTTYSDKGYTYNGYFQKWGTEAKRFSIMTDDMTTCIITGRPRNEIHEVYHGTADRKKSIKWGCCIPLCTEYHNVNSSMSIHNNHELDMYYKKEMQRAFEKIHGHDKFMEIFRKNYL